MRDMTDPQPSLDVLVATDGSERALEAARRAVELLRPGARITLTMVIPGQEDPMETAGGFEGPTITEEEAEEEFAEAANAGASVLAGAAEAVESVAQAAHDEVATRLIPADADLGAAIVDAATEMHADVIVV